MVAAAAPSTLRATAAVDAPCHLYAPEGPGSNVLAAEESDVREPPAEDIYMAAQRQMAGGMRQGVCMVAERSARQQLTGGAADARGSMPSFHAHSSAHSAGAGEASTTTGENNVVPLRRHAAGLCR